MDINSITPGQSVSYHESLGRGGSRRWFAGLARTVAGRVVKVNRQTVDIETEQRGILRVKPRNLQPARPEDLCPHETCPWDACACDECECGAVHTGECQTMSAEAEDRLARRG